MAGQHVGEKSGLPESEARWQKHVVIALWVSLGFLALLTVVLLYGNTHGLFQELSDGLEALWPDAWP